MGGKILEFRGEKEWNAGKEVGLREGKKKGVQQGSIETLAELAHNGMLPLETAETMAKNKYGISHENFRAIVASYSSDERMQG